MEAFFQLFDVLKGIDHGFLVVVCLRDQNEQAQVQEQSLEGDQFSHALLVLEDELNVLGLLQIVDDGLDLASYFCDVLFCMLDVLLVNFAQACDVKLIVLLQSISISVRLLLSDHLVDQLVDSHAPQLPIFAETFPQRATWQGSFL